jgi:hypothetical protein
MLFHRGTPLFCPEAQKNEAEIGLVFIGEKG